MATITKHKAMHSPAHPGEILRELYLKPMHVTITQAAEALGILRVDLQTLISESDVQSIHVPLTELTKRFVNEKVIRLKSNRRASANPKGSDAACAEFSNGRLSSGRRKDRSL